MLHSQTRLSLSINYLSGRTGEDLQAFFAQHQVNRRTGKKHLKRQHHHHHHFLETKSKLSKLHYICETLQRSQSLSELLLVGLTPRTGRQYSRCKYRKPLLHYFYSPCYRNPPNPPNPPNANNPPQRGARAIRGP